jgi:hypothetical protein
MAQLQHFLHVVTRIVMKILFGLALMAAQPIVLHAAQPTPAPTDAKVPVPHTQYQSAFTGYQPYREQAPAPWRDLNDTVHKAGGHIGIVGGAGGAGGKPPAHPPGQKK